MSHVKRISAWLTVLTMILSLSVALPGVANAATSTATATTSNSTKALDARIGGSSKSFTTAFGKAAKTKGDNGVSTYTVKGFGLVAASFLSSKADEVTIAADRLAHKPLTTPDPADWTVANAAKFADTLTPTDSTYGKPVKSATRIEITGHSKALGNAFTQKNYDSLQLTGTPGDFDVVYSLDTAGNVFSVDVSLGAGTEALPTTSTGNATTAGNGTKTANSTGNGVAVGKVVHCKNFSTQAEAQAYFDKNGGDSNPAVSGMDGDKDGKPCESLP